MIRTVSEILSSRFNIEGKAGSKVECPYCHHKTFSIKRDDMLGKCFHPTCGKVVSPFREDAEPGSVLFGVLEEVASDFHSTLLTLAKKPGQHAYSYCVHERGVHPRVLIDFPLGVVPDGYDVAARFAPLLAEAQAELQKAEEAKDRSKTSKVRVECARGTLDQLTDISGALGKVVGQTPGWLVFIYTDASKRVVSFRFRRPYSKSFQAFKPTAIGGCFGHEVFSADGTPADIITADRLIVVEGEFNLLQLQSLCARVAEAKGRAPETAYISACAVGGVHNVDHRTLTRLCPHPVVCYDHDTDGAGLALVENLRRHSTITAFTTPRPDSDLDSFIRSFGPETDGAFEALRCLVARRIRYTRPYDALRAEIDGLRSLEGDDLKRFLVHRRAAEIVLTDLRDRGAFYSDGTRGYFFHSEDRYLIAVEADDLGLELLLKCYGLAPNEEIFRYVRDAMRLEALEHGTKTVVYAFSHYDQTTHTLYVTDFDRGMYRIRPEAIDYVDVGTNGVLFLHNPTWKPFRMVEWDPTRSGLDELILGKARFKEGILLPDEQRVIFMMWLYAIFFPELFPTRPILALIGERGSGKSSHLRRTGRLLFGPSFDVMELTDDPKDFDAAVTNSQLVAVDNADKVVRWLEDKLAVAATGGRIRKRELYTTNRVVEYPITAFIAVTSRTPYFRREDIADRALILQVPRLEQFLPEASLLAELDARRDEVMTEIMGHMQEIVGALRDQEGKTYATGLRMADFADFTLKVAHGLGLAPSMERILQRMASEQTAFALEDEQIVDLLEAWLTEESGRNVGRLVTMAELYREFSPLALKLGIELKFKSAQSIAQTIRHKGSALRELFHITEHKGRGRGRRLSFRPRVAPEPNGAQRAEEPQEAQTRVF